MGDKLTPEQIEKGNDDARGDFLNQGLDADPSYACSLEARQKSNIDRALKDIPGEVRKELKLDEVCDMVEKPVVPACSPDQNSKNFCRGA